MTENKRFVFDSEVGFIDLEKCGGDAISNNEVVDKLNELNDENQELLKFKDTVFQLLSYYIQDIKENNKYGNDCCRINQVELLRTLEKKLKK